MKATLSLRKHSESMERKTEAQKMKCGTTSAMANLLRRESVVTDADTLSIRNVAYTLLRVRATLSQHVKWDERYTPRFLAEVTDSRGTPPNRTGGNCEAR